MTIEKGRAVHKIRMGKWANRNYGSDQNSRYYTIEIKIIEATAASSLNHCFITR
jgi:hypothetical protein